MKHPREDEIEIVGSWKLVGDKVVADEACVRVEWLVRNYLVAIVKAESGWEVVYQDPKDNRYWLYYYPQSEMHGGGPPALKVIHESVVVNKYGG